MNRNSIVLVIALTATGWTSAQADLITSLSATTTAQPGGLTLYSYMLSNDSASTLNVTGFGLTIAPDADLRSISGPEGWDITYFAGGTLVTWDSSDISTYFIAPGSSETFSFLSPLAAIQQPFVVTGSDEFGLDFNFNTGQIASPGVSAVPEPSTLTLLGTGALGLAAYPCRRRPSKNECLPLATS